MTIPPGNTQQKEENFPLQVGERILITHTIPAGILDTWNSPWTNKTGTIEGFWKKLRMDGSVICEMVRVRVNDEGEEGRVISFERKYIERITEEKEEDNAIY